MRKIECKGCKKIWEFDDILLKVKVYHIGSHSCAPKPLSIPSLGKLKAKFAKRQVTPHEARMDILLEAFDNGDDNLTELMDIMLDDQKIRNMKKKLLLKCIQVGIVLKQWPTLNPSS